MKTFLLVIKRYIQTVSQAVVSLVKPEFHLPVLTRAVLRKGLPRYKLSHNSLPSVTLWDRKEVNPGVMRVYPLITHMRAFKAVNPRWSPMAIPHSHQASACGETQQSRYEASSVGNRVTDGKADTLATAGTEHAGCEGFLGSHLGVLLYVENSQSSSCNNPHKESIAPNPNNLTEETPKKETDSILSTADLLGWWHLHATG